MAGSGIALLDREKIFRDLFHVTALRGQHSTGISTVRFPMGRKGKEIIRTKRAPYDAPYFLFQESSLKDSILDDFWASVFIGHCRHATVGKIETKNAHPFELQKIIGAHNGTLTDKEFLTSDKTDSQNMFEKMETDGINPVLDGLNSDSAYAVSIYQRNNGILTLARNTKRTLYLAFNKKRSVLYWSSEFDMLKFVLERHNQDYKIVYLEPYHVYNIDVDQIKPGNETPWESIDNLTDKSKTSKIVGTATYQSNYDEIDWEEVVEKENNDDLSVFKAEEIEKHKVNQGFLLEENDDPWYDYKCGCCHKQLGFKEAMKRRIEVPAKKGGIDVYYVCHQPVCQKKMQETLGL